METKYCNFDSKEIIGKAIERWLWYLSLEALGENRKYFVKSFWVIEDDVYETIQSIHNEVNSIIKFLSTKPEHLIQILPRKVVDVIMRRPWKISNLQRYDIIFWLDWSKNIVEVNSETPAWTPETINTDLFDSFVFKKEEWIYNANYWFCETLLKNFDWYDNVSVVFSDDSQDAFWKTWEDYTNACYLASALKWEVVNVSDIDIQESWLYAYWKRLTNIYSFYPLERYFLDKGWARFRELYIRWEFDIINWPINLISQSKAFWAWIYENIKLLEINWIKTDAIQKFVPKYFYDKKPWTISKPRLYREWVWIWKDLEWSVYQELVEQKLYSIETYEWKKDWYITLWIYCDSTKPIWVYCRFCEEKVTDSSSYFLPIYNKINEQKTINPHELTKCPHTWFM